MNKIFKKLRSRAGESLIESLAAILVVTMASVVMYSMVTAAADINTKAKKNDLTVQQQMASAERADVRDKIGSGTVYMYIEYNDERNRVAEVDVDIFGARDGLYSYFKEVSGG